MRSFRRLIFTVSLLLGGCGELDQEGTVLILVPGYRAELIANERDGITSPDGLLWSDGTLYVADEGGSAVRAWRPDGSVRTLADRRAGLASPEDLVRDAQGTIYASDDSGGGVWGIGPDGLTRLLPAGPTEGLALSASGLILAGDAERHRILRLDLAGAATSYPGVKIDKPESFAFDGRGNLYIADNRANILYLLTRDGRLHRPISERGGFSPESLSYRGGVLHITDSANGKLFRYTPEEGLVTVALFGGKLANVQGVTSDERGNLYVSVQSDLKGGKGFILRLNRVGRGGA